MCTQHTIEEHCKLDPPWDGPQVIPAQLRRVDNLIFRRINQFARANGVEQATPMHGWIIEYLYRHRDEPVFQRDIEREFSITRSTVTNILQLMERKGYIRRLSVPQDARLKQLVLTEEGVLFHEKTMLSFHQTDDYVAGLLTEEENAELLRLLNKLREALK
jgi:MarR family transcriptional repressor of mepA